MASKPPVSVSESQPAVTMKFCQILTFPESHLHAIHAARPHLLDAPFKEHALALAEEPPDATALWTPSIAKMGHDAQLIVANDAVSQCGWVREKLNAFKPEKKSDWMRETVIKQLGEMKPDVLCVGDPVMFDARFIERITSRPRWIIAHSTLHGTKRRDWSGFDLVLSPHEVCVRQAWRNHARDARLLQLGFPRSMAEAVAQEPATLDVVYCGRWHPGDDRRNDRVAALAKAALRKKQPFSLALHLDVPDGAELPPGVRELNQGSRFGLARYHALRRAKIVVTEELDRALGTSIPPGVFEGTGVGAFTLVEENERLPAIFKPGAEVAVYQGTTDLIAKIHEYLGADSTRSAIAKAGQERCLTEHSLEGRMKTLVPLLANGPGGIVAEARRLWHRYQA